MIGFHGPRYWEIKRYPKKSALLIYIGHSESSIYHTSQLGKDCGATNLLSAR